MPGAFAYQVGKASLDQGGIAVRDAEREAREARKHRRVGEWLDRLEDAYEPQGLEGGAYTEVRIRLPVGDGGDTLLILKATGPAGKYIAFVGALDPLGAMLAWRSREGGPGMKWRVEVPWGERGQG